MTLVFQTSTSPTLAVTHYEARSSVSKLIAVARNEAPDPVARSSQKISAATVNAGTTLFFRAITHTVFLAP